MKIALVHDDFVQAGGAESLFATIASIWPEAPVYTSLVDSKKLPQSISTERIRSSFIQKIPFAKKLYKLLLPLYPFAFESFNFDDFDLVFSSTTRFAKSIITKPQTVHISYINSVPRFLHDPQAADEYLSSTVRFVIKPILGWLKRWDKATSARVDFYIANSKNVADQAEDAYRVLSDIIYPYADTNFFTPAKIHKWNLKSQNYFLVVSRLVKWKKIELAIEACSRIGSKLVIVGDGPDKSRLKALSEKFKSECEFRGRVTREELRDLYRNCQALIVTQQEDFGISTVEAQGCGRPVIAYQKGGQAEIILRGKTGILFEDQTVKSLQDAMQRLSSLKWNVSDIRANALRFSKKRFVGELKKTVLLYARRS